MSRRTLSDRIGAIMMRRVLKGFEPGDRHVEITRVETPMSDGTILVGDLLMPDRIEPGTPTIVMRTPYGRSAMFRARMPLPLATWGFPVLLQSARGTFGSGGTFVPQLHEASDGLDTMRWVKQQPWFTGRLATVGSSYLGYTQWAATAGAMAAGEPEHAAEAMSLAVTMPDFGAITWDNGAFSLRNSLTWSRMMSVIESPAVVLTMVGPDRRLQRALDRVPLSQGDLDVVGEPIPWYQDWLAKEDLRDPYWTTQSHTAAVAQMTAPIVMTTGWYDIFLPWQIGTYEILAAQGRAPWLTIGPWTHESTESSVVNLDETIEFFDQHFRDIPSTRTAPVRFLLTGADEWHDAEAWPPAPHVEVDWFLTSGGGLGTTAPDAAAEPTRYTYDPSDPTPATGGPPLRGEGGPVDDREHEQRADVVTFTSDTLAADLDVTGTPVATIWLRSDRPSVDVFVRLTEVHADGRSLSVTDGIRRVGSPATDHTDPERSPDGAWPIEVPLWPTAHRFAAGNRVRVQVSSGAHPRYARNPGTGQLSGGDVELRVAHQEVLHEPGRASSVRLPIWGRP